MKNKFLPIALVAAMFTGFNSCEDLENLCNLSEEDLGSGEVFVTSLNHMMDIYNRIDNAYKDSTLQATGTAMIDGAECTLTIDSMIIDFKSGAACADGKTRKGSIRTSLVSDYTQPGGGVAGILKDYEVNNVPITGDLSVSNDGPAGNLPSVNVLSNSIAVGSESDVDFNLDVQWITGFETMDGTDDKFLVYGDVNGSDLVNSSMFEADVIDSLRYNYACVDHVEKGILDLTITGDSATVGMITVDFIESDGCNNLFSLTTTCEGVPLSFTYPFN